MTCPFSLALNLYEQVPQAYPYYFRTTKEASSVIRTVERTDGLTDPETREPLPPLTGFSRYGYGNPDSLGGGYPALSPPISGGSPSSAIPGLNIPDTVNQPGYEPLPEAPPIGDPPTREGTTPETEEEREEAGYTPVPILGTPNSWNNRPSPGGGGSRSPSSSGSPASPNYGGISGGGGSSAATPSTATPTTTETATVPGTIPPSNPPSDPPKNTKEDCPCNKSVLDRFDNLENLLFGGVTAASDAVSTSTIMTKLDSMDDYARKAWKATRVDKVLNYISYIGALHNVLMLSRFAGSTFLDAVSLGLNFVGVEDEEGNPIDVQQELKSSLDSVLRSTFGDSVVDDVNTAFQRANRIIQIGANLAYTARGLIDGLSNLTEYAANQNAKIGNALKKYGVVGERSYPWMSENVTTATAARAKFQRVYDGIEAVENLSGSFVAVTSEIQSVGSEFNELKDQKDRLLQEIQGNPPIEYVVNDPIGNVQDENKSESQSADIDLSETLRSEQESG